MERRTFIKGIAIAGASLFAGSAGMAFADQSVESIEMTPELATSMAQEFADSLNPSAGLVAGCPVKMYDLEDRALGYVVPYCVHNKPHGYIVYDNTCESLISEFCFDEGVVDPSTAIRESSTPFSAASSSKLYKVGIWDYALCQESSFYDRYGEVLPIEISRGDEDGSHNPSSWDKVLIHITDQSYTFSEFNTVPVFVALSESIVEGLTGKYACGVSAMTHAAIHYGIIEWNNSDIKVAYETLWDLSSTFITSVGSNGIIYGSTYSDKYGLALGAFAERRGMNLSYSQMDSPGFSFFKTAIDGGNVGILSTGIYTSATETSSHAMTVEGYCTATNRSGSFRGLILADGWQGNGRVINIDHPDLYYTYGTRYHK